MRTPIIAGNWKMNKSAEEAVAFVTAIQPLVKEIESVEVVVCPPFTSLESVLEATEDCDIRVGAQNMHWEENGAFTGEISPIMLNEMGCDYVIIGHSERRQFFAETDETVNKKIKSALKTGLAPILCVGENLAEREQNKTEAVIKEQINSGLLEFTGEEVAGIVIAYEPIWAIGTGKTATPAQAEEVCALIRGLISDNYGDKAADKVRIQYGGSVKPDNIGELMDQANIDGALVGGASLEPESFAKIVDF